jgi:hypothetical protein
VITMIFKRPALAAIAVAAALQAVAPPAAANAPDTACTVLKTQISIYVDMVAAFDEDIQAARQATPETLGNIAKQTGTINMATLRLLKPLSHLDNVNEKLNAAASARAALGCD